MGSRPGTMALEEGVCRKIAVILPAITSTIGKSNNIDVDEAESIAVMLSTSIMTDDGGKEILEAVDRKVNVLSGIRVTAKQELIHPEHYQSIETWQEFDGDADSDAKLLAMAKRLRKARCKRLTEPSFKAAAAVALHNQKGSLFNNTGEYKDTQAAFRIVSRCRFRRPRDLPNLPRPAQRKPPRSLAADGR